MIAVMRRSKYSLEGCSGLAGGWESDSIGTPTEVASVVEEQMQQSIGMTVGEKGEVGTVVRRVRDRVK